MHERFTDRARKVMALANQEAQRFNREYLRTEHILLGLVKEGSGTGAKVLTNLNIDLHQIRLEVEKMVNFGPKIETIGRLPNTPRVKKVFEYALEEALNLNHRHVGTEHLLLGLMREQDGVAFEVLFKLGLKLQDTRDEVLRVLLGEKEPVDVEVMKAMDALEIGEPVIIEPKYGPEQVKIFTAGRGDYGGLEEAVNRWLSENTQVKIIHRKYATNEYEYSMAFHYLPTITSVVHEPTRT